MQFSTLLNHSAELLSIICKSSQPADKIASLYLRKKKYIGSADRKFISQNTFSSLRMLTLIKYCNKKANDEITIDLNADNEYFVIALCGFFLSEFYCQNQLSEKPSESLPKYLNNKSAQIEQLLIDAIAAQTATDSTNAHKFLHVIGKVYKNLDISVAKSLENTTDLSDSLYELLQNRFSMPRWILKNWVESKYYKRTVREAAATAESFNYPAPVTVRVNLNQLNRKQAISILKESGIASEEAGIAPSAIIIEKRTQLSGLDIFRRGIIEVQDEGSQLVSYILGLNDSFRILDACAGAGGKSLHIASLQNDKGDIIASDVEFNRLKELRKRALKAGFKSIKSILLNEKSRGLISKGKHSDFIRPFDAILVDAPCSGTGTARRMPMHKYKLTEKLLAKLSKRQLEILEFYSKFLKKGGVLVYATCSVMPEENDGVVDKFLNNNEFSPSPIMPVLDKYGIEIVDVSRDDFKIHLFPDIHKCDGFFVARMIKQ